MRPVVCVTALFLFVAAAAGQERDAPAVLKEMRQALGGEAALDAVRTFSANGTLTFRTPMGPRQLSVEWFAALPDHFLEIRRDSGSAGPMSYSIVYYNGLRGEIPIRKTNAQGMPMPPDPYTLDQQTMLMFKRQEFARLSIVLFGAPPPFYPLTFTYAGRESAEGRTFDVLDGAGPDGFALRLHVDAATHLPAMVSWQAERPFTMTTSSTVAVRGNEVVSRSPETPTAQPPASMPRAEWRWLLSDYKVQDGVNWPRKIETAVPGGLGEEIKLRGIKINPRIDPRRFDVK